MRVALAPAEGAGILSYGHYVPVLRLGLRTLAEQWRMSPAHERMFSLNGRNTVAVNAPDEDSVTLSLEAAEAALQPLAGNPRPDSLLIGSESHPYAVKPSAAIVADALGLAPDVFCADLEFACKAGTAAVLLSAALTRSSFSRAALAIGADCPQSAPGSLLEASVGSAAAAFVIGRGDAIASIDAVASASSDLSDFWRRDGAQFPSVAGKFSVDAGYLEHTLRVGRGILEATGTRPADYRYVCLHQPYASLPQAAAKQLGFERDQVSPGLVAGQIGNAYSSCSLLSLCAILDVAQPGERILLVSFGSGAGSDGLALTVTGALPGFRERCGSLGRETVSRQIGSAHADWLTYGQYALGQGKLRP